MAEPYPKTKQLARGERRYRRKVASPKQWAAIRADKLEGAFCRCVAHELLMNPDKAWLAQRATQLHHLVPRSQGGDDVADNLVPICPDCHGAIHRRDPRTLRLIAESLTEAERGYCIGKLGPEAMQRLFGV